MKLLNSSCLLEKEQDKYSKVDQRMMLTLQKQQKEESAFDRALKNGLKNVGKLTDEQNAILRKSVL
jgi:hypothetical protein